MNFPFSTNKKYFTAKEQKHLDEFAEAGPNTGEVWTNGKGEKRRVMRLWLPEGMITKQTVYSPPLQDDSRKYHTPLAKEEGVLARIMFEQDGKADFCTSEDWLKWAGKEFVRDRIEDEGPSEEEKAHAEAVAKMISKTVDPSKGDEFTKGGKWDQKHNKK